MLLTPQEFQLFRKLHTSLMCFINGRLLLAPGISTPDQFSVQPPAVRLQFRNALLEQPELIEEFVESNPFGFSDDELAIVSSWRHSLAGKFFILRYLQKHAVFLTDEDPAVAYGVVALRDPISLVAGSELPIWTKAILMPFKDKIIYDGIIERYSISIGPGIRRGLDESYKQAKKRLGIVTRLPMEAKTAVIAKPVKRGKPRSVQAAKGETRDALDVILNLIDSFCRDHLNEEYAVLCRNLAEKLARKRPSPLLSGKPNTWACGIVRTIGWVNYLDDRSQKPHMKLTAIDKAFGVGESTGQGKSMLIRRTLKIRPFDPDWTLPSLMDDNPLVWMVEVAGFMVDIRHCKREVQQAAFERGIIPYVPADRA